MEKISDQNGFIGISIILCFVVYVGLLAATEQDIPQGRNKRYLLVDGATGDQMGDSVGCLGLLHHEIAVDYGSGCTVNVSFYFGGVGWQSADTVTSNNSHYYRLIAEKVRASVQTGSTCSVWWAALAP